MSTESGPGRWVPKAFRPEDPPNPAELIDLIVALRAHASRSTAQLFESLARQPPSKRLLDAAVYVIRCMERNPLLSNVLQQALTIDEYSSLKEVTVLPLTPRQKATAEHLLCIRERELVGSFFRRVFRDLDLQAEQFIHEFDLPQQESEE